MPSQVRVLPLPPLKFFVVRFIPDFRAGATTWHRFSLFVRQRVNGVERKPPCGLLSRYSEAIRPSLSAEDRFELRNGGAVVGRA